jgi:putative endonuclease
MFFSLGFQMNNSQVGFTRVSTERHPEARFVRRRTLRLFVEQTILTSVRERRFYVYMTTSSSRRALYTGVSNNVYRRKDEHDSADNSSFVGRYKAYRLVYLEVFEDVRNAIDREKEIKGWTRAKKEALVRSVNPQWRDLSAAWRDRYTPQKQVQPQGPSGQKSRPSG